MTWIEDTMHELPAQQCPNGCGRMVYGDAYECDQCAVTPDDERVGWMPL